MLDWRVDVNAHLIWQALSILWLLVSLYLGGFWLLLGALRLVPSFRASNPPEAWWLAPAGLALLLSGAVAVTLAFFPGASILRTFVEVLAAIALLVVSIGVPLLVLTLVTRNRPGADAAISVWWPRLRTPLRLAFVGGTLAVAAVDRDAGSRLILLLLAGMQLFPVVFEMWLRRRHGHR